MTSRLDRDDAERLIKILGRLGSDHEGERAVAGLKATELLRARKLTWFDVIPIQIADHSTNGFAQEPWEAQRRFCLQHTQRLTPKELGFLISIGSWNGPLTERQKAWLDSIHARLRSKEMAA